MRDIYAVKDNVFNITKGIGTPTWGAGMTGALDLNDTQAAARGSVFYNDGLVLDTSFKGDIDIPHLSFGNDNVSIGEIYLTDLEVHRKLTISAH
jgi:hypothetical protein